jgi:ferredoxin-nitrite reductase
LDANGFDWTIEKIQEQLDGFGNDVKLLALDSKFDAPRAEINRQGHIGVHPQSQEGLNYIGVALNVGHMSPEQMRRIGDLSMRYGKNDIRLTVWQNVIIPHVADADVDAVVAEIEAMGLTTSATSFAAGAISCTGRWGCKLANAYTKQDTETLVKHLQERFELDQPINIHTTGCNNSCAQHYIGDIGLIGTPAPGGGEGYTILVGGGCDQDQGLARHLHGPIPASELPQWGEKLIRNYLAARDEGESFLSFTRRHEQSDLQAILLR